MRPKTLSLRKGYPPMSQYSSQPSRTAWTLWSFALVGALLGLGWAGWTISGQARATFAWKRALDAIAREDFETAQFELDFARSIWKDSSEVYLESARVARQLGQYDRAHQLLDECRHLQGEEYNIQVERALVMAQEGKLSQVEGFLEKMANPKGPFRVEILKTLTPLYFGMFDMTKANMISKLWTEAEPGSAEAFQWRGLILDRIGSKEDTDAAFSKSLELDPNRVDVLIYLASRKLRSHEPQAAIPLIDRAERLSPDHVDLPLLRARSLSEMGKEEEARAFLASHVSKDPHPAIFRELGRLELKAGKIADALEHLKRAVDAFPMDQSIRFSLAQAQEQLGKKEDAAATRARLKEIEAALDKMKVITQQVVTKPNDPAPRAEAAKIMAQNGVGIEACRWAMSALRLDPENVEARKVLQENQASLAEVNQYRSVLEYLR